MKWVLNKTKQKKTRKKKKITPNISGAGQSATIHAVFM